jgi:predicted phage tail protein
LRALNRIFGAIALMIGITFLTRVLAALLVHGLSLRQVWLAGVLGVALILVGVIYVRAPSARG